VTPRELWSKLTAAFHRRKIESDLEDEIQSHIELAKADRMARGVSAEEAARQAAVNFGSITLAKEQAREQRGIRSFAIFAQDARYALRGMRRSPGFTLVAVVTLALGIGLCSMAFAVLSGAFLQPLPGVPDAARLATLENPVTFPSFENFRDHSGLNARMAAYIGPAPVSVGVGDAPAERITGHIVSLEYFSTIGIEPLLGRFFDPAEDRPGEAPVAVVSERFWRIHLHAVPDVIGSAIRINGRPARIVGVAPKDFLGASPLPNAADIYLPVTADARVAPELTGDALHSTAYPRFRVLLRLPPGLSQRAAEARLDAQARLLEDRPSRDKKARLVRVIDGGSLIPLPPEARAMIEVFYGLMVALILTLTCANLAGLILARGAARTREIAIRLSIGADRARLVRQLLTESLVLAALGGLGALAASRALFWLIARFRVDTMPAAWLNWGTDARAAIFTFAIAAAAGIGFGLMPALAVTRPELANALRTGVTTLGNARRRFGLRNLFVVYQMAAAMMLMLIMGASVLGVLGSLNQPAGFEVAPLYVFSVDPARDGLTPEESAALCAGMAERLTGIRAIESVTIADRPPLAPGLPSVEMVAGDRTMQVVLQMSGPRFFATLGAPLVRGAEFTDRDWLPAAIPPAVINRTAAKELFGDADPLGREIRQGARTFQVIGVAAYDQPQVLINKPVSVMFVPFTAKDAWRAAALGITVVVRARGPLDMAAIRGLLDPRMTMFHQQTLRESIDETMRGARIAMAFYLPIGAFGLVLACVGLAGVTAQTVERRRKEIGIRMALGARRSQLLGLIMREGATMVGIGACMGCIGAYAMARVLAAIWSPLAQIVSGSTNPWLTLFIPALLISLAALACYVPARRSSSIDPLIALREE
jgi:macrolide transport system ATP-binding/permease protein